MRAGIEQPIVSEPSGLSSLPSPEQEARRQAILATALTVGGAVILAGFFDQRDILLLPDAPAPAAFVATAAPSAPADPSFGGAFPGGARRATRFSRIATPRAPSAGGAAPQQFAQAAPPAPFAGFAIPDALPNAQFTPDNAPLGFTPAAAPGGGGGGPFISPSTPPTGGGGGGGIVAPENGAWVMMISGLFGLAGMMRRRNCALRAAASVDFERVLPQDDGAELREGVLAQQGRGRAMGDHRDV